MKKVYLAGPQVFLPNAEEWFEQAIATCLALDLIALVPLNKSLTGATEIFEYNKTLIRQADCVLADITPFRGSEPDSGTAWEIGFAHALDKPVFMYSKNCLSMRDKALRYFGKSGYDQCEYFPDGMSAEGFGYAVNLMLAKSGQTLKADIDEAVLQVALFHDQMALVNALPENGMRQNEMLKAMQPVDA